MPAVQRLVPCKSKKCGGQPALASALGASPVVFVTIGNPTDRYLFIPCRRCNIPSRYTDAEIRRLPPLSLEGVQKLSDIDTTNLQ